MMSECSATQTTRFRLTPIGDNEQRAPSRTVHVRPIRARDAGALRDGYQSLSRLTRYYRFRHALPRLSQSMLEYLTRVDHVNHVALVAIECVARRAPRGVGVARFVRTVELPECAEVGIVVVDDRQRCGVGTRLMHELALAARRLGVTTFIMEVLRENAAACRLLAKLGATPTSHDGCVLTYRVAVEGFLADQR
jgi:RimJ/RimL family protein N-acetyltransferase